jgi:hypothetical protein
MVRYEVKGIAGAAFIITLVIVRAFQEMHFGNLNHPRIRELHRMIC